MEDRRGYIWYDGELKPWNEVRVHVLTHTLHYGTGVFEGIRAYEARKGTAVFRLEDHVSRLFRSARILNIPIPCPPAEVTAACLEAVSANQLQTAYIRPMCFLGAEGLGLRTDNLSSHLIVAAWHWDTYLGPKALEQGIRVKTSSFTKLHVNSGMCKAKVNGNYVNSMLALQEARASGCEEALLLDTDGYVAECSGENIFIVRDGRIYTPEATAALEGITRDTVLRIAEDRGLNAREKRITRDEVYGADEVFLTGTAAEVTPVRELDSRQIGTGGRGPITERLQRLYFDHVHGRSEAHGEWLHYLDGARNAQRQPRRHAG
ncbi:MAG: branched-chain amino acid transaminase [Gammaproteobacteria bacterium]|nr:branched-chain amino acid transaminase [Gammaproteobacteria bacterium]MDD9864376.1 branched-chain amino acid transaminase [Gammaproteobacteria bacterium]